MLFIIIKYLKIYNDIIIIILSSNYLILSSIYLYL